MNCQDLSLNSLISQRNDNKMIYSENQKPCNGEQLEFYIEDNAFDQSYNTLRQNNQSTLLNHKKIAKKNDFSFNEGISPNNRKNVSHISESFSPQRQNSEQIRNALVSPQQLSRQVSNQEDFNTYYDQSTFRDISDIDEKQKNAPQINLIFQHLLKVQFEEISNQEQLQLKHENLMKKLERHTPQISKQMWRFKFFKLLLLTNRFLHKMKKTLIFTRPHMLQKEQADAINDKSAFNLIQNDYQYLSLFIHSLFSGTLLSCFISFLIQLIFPMKYPLALYLRPTLMHQIIFLLLATFSYSLIRASIIEVCQFLNQKFNISFSLLKGEPQTSRWMILKNYLKQQSLIEIVSLVSLYWKNPFQLRVLRIAYLVKLKHLGRLSDKVREYFQIDDKYAQVTNLVLLLVQILYLCHVFACLWYKIGKYINTDLEEKSWIDKFQQQNLSEQIYYVNSIYYAIITIITIGYGDITPEHYLEKLFIVFMAFLSCVNFGYALNQIGAIIQEINQKQQKYRVQIAGINKYMKEMQVTYSLQSQARKYLEYAYAENFNQDYSSISVLENLSSNLKNLIKREVHMRYLREIPCMRKNFSPQFLERISLFFKEKSYGSGETIVDQYESKQPSIQIVMRGKVQVSLKHRQAEELKKFKRLKPQNFFGMYEFFSQSPFSLYSVYSIGISTILYLELQDFLKQLEEFPNDKEMYCLLKDQLNIFSQFEKIGLECLSCKSQGHLVNQCKLFSYQPNHLKVIQDYLKSEDDEIKKIKRKKKKKFHSLLSLQENKVIIEEIQNNTIYEEDSQKNLEDQNNSDFLVGSERSKSHSNVDQKSQQLISLPQLQVASQNLNSQNNLKQELRNSNLKINEVDEILDSLFPPLQIQQEEQVSQRKNSIHSDLMFEHSNLQQNIEYRGDKRTSILGNQHSISILKQSQSNQQIQKTQLKNEQVLSNDNNIQMMPILISTPNNVDQNQSNQMIQDIVKEIKLSLTQQLNIPNGSNYRKSLISQTIISQNENPYLFQTESIKSYKIYFPHNNLENLKLKQLSYKTRRPYKNNGSIKGIRIKKVINNQKQSTFFNKKY